MFGIGDKVWNRNHGYGVITWEINDLKDWYEVKFDCGVTCNFKASKLNHSWEV